MSRRLEPSIERLRGRVSRAVFGSTLLWALGLGLLALACVALLARAAFDVGAGPAAALFAPLACAPYLAWRATRRKSLSKASAAAWLDARTGATGAVVTSFEAPDETWDARVEALIAHPIALPRARLGRPALLAALGLAFAVVALVVPIPRARVGPDISIQRQNVERVAEKLATLEEEVTLAPEVAAELHETLERLKDEDALAHPESAFEAADRALDRLEQEAAAREDAAESARESLAAADSGAGLDPATAQEELQRALHALQKAGLAKGLEDLLPSGIDLATLDLPAGTKLDAETLARLAGPLSAKLGDKLAKLAAAGLLKPGSFARAGTPGDLSQFKDHVCTAECRKQPGGT